MKCSNFAMAIFHFVFECHWTGASYPLPDVLSMQLLVSHNYNKNVVFKNTANTDNRILPSNTIFLNDIFSSSRSFTVTVFNSYVRHEYSLLQPRWREHEHGFSVELMTCVIFCSCSTASYILTISVTLANYLRRFNYVAPPQTTAYDMWC